MRKLFLVKATFVAIGMGGLAVTQQSQSASAATCDTNHIIRCGVTSQTDLRNQYARNTTNDLPAVYSHYGISSNMLNNTKAKWGYVYVNGDVKVDNVVVATGAKTVGRENIPGSKPVTIGGKVFYERTPSVSFSILRQQW
jgi:hypothetical protein